MCGRSDLVDSDSSVTAFSAHVWWHLVTRVASVEKLKPTRNTYFVVKMAAPSKIVGVWHLFPGPSDKIDNSNLWGITLQLHWRRIEPGWSYIHNWQYKFTSECICQSSFLCKTMGGRSMWCSGLEGLILGRRWSAAGTYTRGPISRCKISISI